MVLKFHLIKHIKQYKVAEKMNKPSCQSCGLLKRFVTILWKSMAVVHKGILPQLCNSLFKLPITSEAGEAHVLSFNIFLLYKSERSTDLSLFPLKRKIHNSKVITKLCELKNLVFHTVGPKLRSVLIFLHRGHKKVSEQVKTEIWAGQLQGTCLCLVFEWKGDKPPHTA